MTGYKLDANGTWIFAYHVTEEQRRLLLSVPNARAGEALVALPATRENFLSAEVVAPVASVTEEYQSLRAAHLHPGDDRVREAIDRCRAVGVRSTRLLTYQLQALAQFYDRSAAYLAADQGCVAGETVVAINRAGKGWSLTVEELHRKFNETRPYQKGCQRWDLSIPTHVRALCDGEFRQHRLVSVVSTGVKPVLRLETSRGKVVRLTGDHEVAMADGTWRQAAEIRVGDWVLCNGRLGAQNSNWRGGKRKLKGGYVGTYFPMHPSADANGCVPTHRLVMESYLGRYLSDEEIVHHRDGNPKNNELSNLQLTTKSEHPLLHHCRSRMDGGIAGRGGAVIVVPKAERIVSICSDGDAEVYDLVMEDPHRNFVANGVVLHNCGKTRIALILARLWDAQRVLVVCPKSIGAQWHEEQRKVWESSERFYFENLTHGSLEERQKVLLDLRRQTLPAIVTVNYEMVAALQADLFFWEPDVLIIDEAWKLKNRTTRVTKALTGLAKAWRDTVSMRTIALAGTPWGNDVGDIWSQIRIVAPEIVPEKYDAFIQSYANLQVQRVARGRTVVKPVGLRDPVGLIRRLDSVWFRTSKEVCLDLPPKTRRRVMLELPEETHKLYRAVKKDGLAALGDDLALAGAREVAVRLHQIAGGHRPGPPMVHEGGWWLEPIENCPKIAWLREFAEDVLASDPSARCLVWCQYVAEVLRVSEVLGDVLGGPSRVTACYGNTPDFALEQAKESYQSRDPDGVQVLVCQWQKMAAGHDLWATSHSIVFSPTWSHILYDQAEDRGHRIGNTTGLQVIELCAKATIDEDVYRALARKQDFSERLLVSTVAGEKIKEKLAK